MRLLFALLVVALIAGCAGGGPGRDLSAFDDYGYNEVAGIFNGSYFNNYADTAGYDPWVPGDDTAYLYANPGADSHWAWPYRDVNVLMKWNQDWDDGNDLGWAAASVDDFDAAWLTNHQSGSYVDGGQTYNWSYFVKIVWVGPAPAGTDPYAGYRIWGQFAIIEEVYNDQGTGDHGSVPIPGPNGFGAY